MSEIILSSILLDNLDTLKIVVVGLFVIFAITSIVRKVFKLALIFILIAVFAYYVVPQLSAFL
ncbi:MAG: hypothetical protein GX958_08815 [Desulfitobacterium sp.]|nr:hypothetical protein [Desulfitobacterium sp.]